MRVEKAPPPTHTQNARDVEPRRTPVSQAELREAIARAHRSTTGRDPSPATLDVLTAHASLETASGARMYNFNFGGMKGCGPAGETARCKTREVLDGKEVTIRDGFRAYRTLDEGAADYLRFMQTKFPAAMAHASRGDVDKFANALKRSHYYTADEGAYAAGLRGLMQEGGDGPPAPSIQRISNASGLTSADTFVDDAQLVRVMDAIAHHRAATESDDDE